MARRATQFIRRAVKIHKQKELHEERLMTLDVLVLTVWQPEIDNKQKPLSCRAGGPTKMELSYSSCNGISGLSITLFCPNTTQ